MNPFTLFKEWYGQAAASGLREPDAMVVATSNAKGQPSARILLLKAWDERGFVFYTNSLSHKGHDLKENPKAALLFYWMDLGEAFATTSDQAGAQPLAALERHLIGQRQVRVEGNIEQVTAKEADDYFASRRRESQLGAWASSQSEKLESREALMKCVEEYRQKFEGKDVPRPPHWLGYRVIPNSIEFWEEGDFRLHTRRLFKRTGQNWKMELLNP